MTESNFCGNCGVHLPPHSTFCKDCGHRVEDGAPPAGPPPPPGPPAPPAPPVPPLPGQGPTYVVQKRSNTGLYVVLGCLVILVISCPLTCIVMMGTGAVTQKVQREKAEKHIQAAEAYWKKGQEAEAVSEYKILLEKHLTSLNSGERNYFFARVIEHDLEAGDLASAQHFIQLSLDRRLVLELTTPEAKKLYSEMWDLHELKVKKELEKKTWKEREIKGPGPTRTGFRSRKEVLGQWQDEPGGLGRLILFRQEGRVYMECTGEKGQVMVREVEARGSEKHTYQFLSRKAKDDYFVIDQQGDLQFWGQGGHRKTAKRIP